MHDYDNPAWGPLPVRPAALRWLLLLPLTLVFLPLWWVIWLLLAAFFYFVATVTQLIIYVLPRAEGGAVRMLDATLGQVPFLPLWCMTPVALVREGDTAYYRARVDRRVEKQTRRVETSRYDREYQRDLDLGAHYFRGWAPVTSCASPLSWAGTCIRCCARTPGVGSGCATTVGHGRADRSRRAHPLSRRRH
ncbi:hypothetical protein ACIQAC_30765 [Streptomyces sp. NPDC088387]|uniref:hypothetical protein n=1 Tax=Streptomyces sp. NPDC088387 TaxID=3365859 RepID=UPI00381EC857